METALNPPKPCLMYGQFLSRFSSRALSKRNYKYVHSLRIHTNQEEKREVKTLPKLKYISSIHRAREIARNTPAPKLPLWQKLVKQHRKYLRNIKGDLHYPSIQRHLPQLSELSLGLNKQERPRWRLLTSESAFRKLFFDFGSFKISGENGLQQHESLVQQFLSKENKKNAVLCRRLPKLKDLRSLEIKLPNISPELILSVLKIISDKVCMDSLKHLGFYICEQYGYNQIEPVKTEGALSFITKCFVNLSDLSINFTKHKELWDPSYLMDFNQLLRLKRMTLIISAHSFGRKDEFFEHFLMPPALENFDLTLQDFGWDEAIEKTFENSPIYTKFFERVQRDGQKLRTLNLEIRPFWRSGFIKGKFSGFLKPSAHFARLLIQQFTHLEHLSYEYHGTTDIDEENSLEIEHFWKALVPSKETLQSVYIFSPPMTFPESINAFEFRFPRLQRLKISGYMFPFTLLGTFCRGFPSLENIRFESVYFFEEKELECFLTAWHFVPQKTSFEAKLYFPNKISKELVVDCLKKFVSDAKVLGKFKVKIYMGRQQRDILQGLFEVVEKKKDEKLFVDYDDSWLSLDWKTSSD